MKLRDFFYTVLFVIIIAIVSYFYQCYVIRYSIDHHQFLNFVPEIIGLQFAGILTCLAIIFGFLRYEELDYIKKNNNMSKVEKYFKNLKQDFQLVFTCFFGAMCVYLLDTCKIISDIFIKYEINFDGFALDSFICIFINFLLIAVTLSCVLDVINSLFTLNETKLQIYKKKQTSQTNLNQFENNKKE